MWRFGFKALTLLSICVILYVVLSKSVILPKAIQAVELKFSTEGYF